MPGAQSARDRNVGSPDGPRLALGIGLILIAFNLRLIFASLSPVLPELMHDLTVSPTAASFLTTTPVVCLGIFAPFTAVLASRITSERLLLVLLVTLTVGTSLRGVETYSAIFAGSLVGGASIAMMNVLLPGLVKRDFPDRVPLMTGLYSMALCAGAALAAGLTAPLNRALGGAWPWALASWSVPTALAAVTWAVLGRPVHRPDRGTRPKTGRLWRDPLAWQVTMFMGMQSALAYSVFGWLAPILRERGLDATTAGWLVSLSVFSQTVASLMGPWLATRGRDQRLPAVLMTALALSGLLGMLLLPVWSVPVWAIVQGAGQGALFSVAMTIIILRSPDAATAAGLSGMSQAVGYVFAALAPLLIGVIRDVAGSFGPTAFLFGGVAILAAVAACGAGRERLVGISPGR